MNKSCVTCRHYPDCEQQRRCKVWRGEYDDRYVVELLLWAEKEGE